MTMTMIRFGKTFDGHMFVDYGPNGPPFEHAQPQENFEKTKRA
jgi:hypothetical protein